MKYAPLWYALGIISALYLPPVLAWVMTIGERTHAKERYVSVDQILDGELGKGDIPRQRGRHTAMKDQ